VSFDSNSADDWDNYDDYIAAKVFDFHPSGLNSSKFKEGHLSDLESTDEVSWNGAPTQGLKASTEFPVYQSQYTGEGSLDGLHGASLTVVHDPKRQRQPLFRWL
jgi:hypothetical protein